MNKSEVQEYFNTWIDRFIAGAEFKLDDMGFIIKVKCGKEYLNIERDFEANPGD